MFDVLQSKHVRENEDVEGFGIRYDSEYGKSFIENPVIVNGGSIIDTPFLNQYVSVDNNGTRTVSFTPLAGVFAQGKLLPLRYLPITIELEVVNNLYDPIISNKQPGWNQTFAGAVFGLQAGSTAIPPVNFVSSTRTISNVVAKCDVCRMDNQLENEFAQRFLSGQSIPINFSSFVVQQQQLSGQSPSVNITRALSRLKSVFMTLVGTPASSNSEDAVGDSAGARGMFMKDWNDYYHPMSAQQRYNASKEFEVQLQIGGKKFPEYPLRSLAESYSALRKCMGIQSSTFHSIDRTHKFIVGIYTEKVLQASFSGENIKNGSLLTILMKNVSNNTADYPTGVYVTMHYDAVLNIKDTGVELLD